jgi:hemoglobin
MRHAPFPVNQAARDRWMKLMDQALKECNFTSDVKGTLRDYFESTATAMMNRG